MTYYEILAECTIRDGEGKTKKTAIKKARQFVIDNFELF